MQNVSFFLIAVFSKMKQKLKLRKENAAKKAAKKSSTKAEEPVMNSNVEKTTLGDIEELAALKEKLDAAKK